MKFSSLISVVVFIAALAWTWSIIHSSGSVSFETHAGIQEKLAQIIVETVKSKRPLATGIVVDKIWTEATHAGRVKAHFLYSFKDSTAEGLINSQIEGFADLEKGGQDGTGVDRWVVSKVKANSDAIVFEEGLTITAGPSDGTAPNDTAAPETEKTGEPKKEH